MNTKILTVLNQLYTVCHIWKRLALMKWQSNKYTMLFHHLFVYYFKYDRKDVEPGLSWALLLTQ